MTPTTWFCFACLICMGLGAGASYRVCSALAGGC